MDFSLLNYFSLDGFSWVNVFKIILMDIVLAGDNAIVIAIAANRLPLKQRRFVIFLGTFFAIVFRAALTFGTVELLSLPWLRFIGGVLLLFIAVKLLTSTDITSSNDSSNEQSSRSDLWKAIQTIFIADVVMSLDNVLAIAASAEGSHLLIIIGLLVSVPIVVWGSQLVSKLLHRFPIVIYIGTAVLGHAAAKIILEEEFVKDYFQSIDQLFTYLTYVVLTVLPVLVGYLWQKRKLSQKINEDYEHKKNEDDNQTDQSA